MVCCFERKNCNAALYNFFLWIVKSLQLRGFIKIVELRKYFFVWFFFYLSSHIFGNFVYIPYIFVHRWPWKWTRIFFFVVSQNVINIFWNSKQIYDKKHLFLWWKLQIRQTPRNSESTQTFSAKTITLEKKKKNPSRTKGKGWFA